MKFDFNLLILIALPIYFGYRHIVEYESFSHKYWGIPERFAAALFFSYLILVMVIGKEALFDLTWTLKEGTKHIEFFIIPGIAFAFAMFPRIASEYSSHYIHLGASGLRNSIAFVGWTGICWLFLIMAI